MGAKSKKRRKHRPSTNPLQEAERQFARRNFRDALKEARRAYRQQPNEATRRFLETASLARVREMQQYGLRDEARALASSILEMGVESPSVKDQLPAVLADLGMFDQAVAGNGKSVDSDPAVLKRAADQAVVRPEEAPHSLPRIREEAELVRSALELLEAGQDDAALEKLKPISRHSVFSDWRLLVRGLAAYYRGDAEQMSAAWDRLEPDRFAARIATKLRAVAGSERTNEEDFNDSAFLKLEKIVLGGNVLGDLRELQRMLAASQWKNAVPVLRRLRASLQPLDPELWRRVCSLVYYTLLRKGEQRTIDRLKPWVDAPAIDPNWHRAIATIAQREEGLLDAEESWRRYLDDLDRMAELSPEDRKLAKAMVHRSLGQLWMEEAVSELEPLPGHLPEGSDEESLASAIEHLETCVEMEPGYVPGYEHLAKAHRYAGNDEQAARAFERLLRHRPDHQDALISLIDHYVWRKGDPLKARPLVDRVRRLNPLDPTVIDRTWQVHVAASRQLALKKQYDSARAELDAAESMGFQNTFPYTISVRRAMLEFKAGQHERAEQYVEQAKDLAPEATPVLLTLAVEAVRYRLPRAMCTRFEREWKKLIKRRCRSETAAQMSNIMRSYLAAGIRHPRWVAYAEQVMQYVRRASRVKWKKPGELREVCDFLMQLHNPETEMLGHEADEVLERRLRKGLREFPQDPYFLIMTAESEITKGPMGCNRRLAYSYLQRGIELASRSPDRRDAALADLAKRRLTFLGEVGVEKLPPYGFLPPFMDFGEDDEEYGDEDLDAPLPKMLPNLFRRLVENLAGSLGVPPDELIHYIGNSRTPEEAAEKLGLDDLGPGATGGRPKGNKGKKR